jgi:polar amino acid transport system substrate-binding protein
MKRWILAALAFLPLEPAPARTLEVCVSDTGGAPLSYPNREGQGQYLLRVAAARLGDEVKFIVEPRRRCLDNVEHGRYQVLLLASYTPEHEHFAFPMMRDGQLDATRAIGGIDNYVIKVKGSTVTWDGRTLGGFNHPILVMNGRRTVHDHLLELQLPANDSPNHPESIAEMLLSERGDAAILTEREWKALQADPRVAQHLEALTPPFLHDDLYCVFNRQFAAENADYVETVWSEFEQIRATREWALFLRTFEEGGASGVTKRRR